MVGAAGRRGRWHVGAGGARVGFELAEVTERFTA